MPALGSRSVRVPVLVLVSLALLVGGALAFYHFSPWPGALLIRSAFSKTARRVNADIAPRVPAGIEVRLDIAYHPGNDDARLDVYWSPATVAPAPTVVWVHGGAFVGGDKAELGNYLSVLASKGYTVVGINYSLAPGAHYPTPVVQLRQALAFLVQHADSLRVNPSRLFLAGDSAGAQIVSQYACITTSPGYAGRLGVAAAPGVPALRGLILCCGMYDFATADPHGEAAGFLSTVLWAYSGTRDFGTDERFALFPVAEYVTAAYPPAFITGGRSDPLTPQSQALAGRLASLGVEVDSLFFGADHQPPPPHEYQFNLFTMAGLEALSRITAFIDSSSTNDRDG